MDFLVRRGSKPQPSDALTGGILLHIFNDSDFHLKIHCMNVMLTTQKHQEFTDDLSAFGAKTDYTSVRCAVLMYI